MNCDINRLSESVAKTEHRLNRLDTIMKNTFTAVIALLLISCATVNACAATVQSVNHNIQPEWALHCTPRNGIVVNCEPTTEYDINDEPIYVVTVRDTTGNLWQFDSCDGDWLYGDHVAMVLYDKCIRISKMKTTTDLNKIEKERSSMTTEMIKKAQENLKAVFDEDGPFESVIPYLNSIDYYLDRAMEEAKGDEHVLEIRDKLLTRKRDRIKDLEEELQACYKALSDMSERCDRLCEQNDALTIDLQGTEAARTDALKAFNDTQTKLTIAEDECHFYKQTIDSLHDKLEASKGTIKDLYSDLDSRVVEISKLYKENAELKTQLGHSNEIIMKLLYGEPVT